MVAHFGGFTGGSAGVGVPTHAPPDNLADVAGVPTRATSLGQAQAVGVPTDASGRQFRTLRLSLTPVCNLACAYCNPARDFVGDNRSHPPDFYLERVARLLAVTPISAVHLTGGEPTLYAQLVEVIRGLRALGLARISLTTNGLRLANHAGQWRDAGLHDVNVSMDALSRRGFRRMTGHDRRDGVLAGVQAALDCGLPVKVNCTVMRGRNERELRPLAHYLAARGVRVRFLELMDMGPLRTAHAELLVPLPQILRALAPHEEQVARLPREPCSTAQYFQTKQGLVFGVIANHSESFCGDCDRLRLTHSGQLMGCLSSPRAHDFPRPTGATTLENVLQNALGDKVQAFAGCDTSMQAIGG